MKILVNPDSPPEDLLDFDWLSDSMNAPGKWVVNQKEKMRPYTLTLDGHSTVLVYSLEGGKGSWRSLKDLGTYVLVPEHLGEGAVFLPHEYELTVNVSFEECDVSFKVICDAEELEAITLELKGQNPDTILEALDVTLQSMVIKTMELHHDSLPLEQGKNMKIPKKVIEQLNYSFGILGLKLRKILVLKVETKTPIPKVKIDEALTSPLSKTEDEEEYGEVFSEDELRQIPVPPSSRTSRAKADSIAAEEHEDETSGIPIPSPSSTPSSPAMVPPPPSTDIGIPEPAPEPSFEEPAEAKPVPKAKTSRRVKPTKPQAVAPVETKKETGKLFANVSWFDRMILQRSYPLSITISTMKGAVQATISSAISGERSTGVETEMQATLGEQLIVKPVFPGCLVTPMQATINADQQEHTLMFWVTPLAKGDLRARLIFEQNGKVIHELKLNGKVITHRTSKIFGWLGLLTGALPPVFAFLFNETPSEFYQTRLSTFAPSLQDLGIMLNTSIVALLFMLSGGFYLFDRQKQSQMNFYLN